mgnify:CR=1 FL=1|jgi:hypothetical protein
MRVQADCERILVMMLLEGVLKQTFNFTAYAVNGYLERGRRAQVLFPPSAT